MANPAIARSLQSPGMNQEQEDFAAKLILIETEARLVLQDLSPGVMRNRVQHIATIAALLRSRLDVASSVILPTQPRKM
jgi:hypothetical protein